MKGHFYSYAIKNNLDLSEKVFVVLSRFYFTNIRGSQHSRGRGGRGGGYLFNSSLPLPPAAQPFRH